VIFHQDRRFRREPRSSPDRPTAHLTEDHLTPVRHANLAREDGHVTRNSSRNPAGIQPRPVKAGRQPEASLARREATLDVKRRQRARRPCHRAPKSLNQSPSPTRSESRKATPTRRQWPGVKGGRGQRTGHVRIGFPRNVGRLSSPRASTGLVPRAPTTRLRDGDRWALPESETNHLAEVGTAEGNRRRPRRT
jgi:hypothetical protein